MWFNFLSETYTSLEWTPGSITTLFCLLLMAWSFWPYESEEDMSPEEFAKFTSSELYNEDGEARYLGKEHLEPIALRQWKTVLSWIAFHPDEVANLTDNKGQTVLHHAALFRAPASLIESILWAAPELASVANRDGELPLHWAVRLSTPPQVLALLLKANPETSFWTDNGNESALSLVWERHQSQLLQTWRTNKEDFLNGKHRLWKKILLFFQALHSQKLDHNEEGGEEEKVASSRDSFSPLFLAASRSTPPCLFPLMIEIYRDHLDKTFDGGELPLIAACQSPIANRNCDVLTKIQLMLREIPEAAKYESVQHGRRYPLHVALASGVTWDDGIESLLHAFPTAVSIRDPKSGLFPFALAATCTENHHMQYVAENEQEKQYDGALTTMYSVLRTDPSVVRLVGF